MTKEIVVLWVLLTQKITDTQGWLGKNGNTGVVLLLTVFFVCFFAFAFTFFFFFWDVKKKPTVQSQDRFFLGTEISIIKTMHTKTHSVPYISLQRLHHILDCSKECVYIAILKIVRWYIAWRLSYKVKH